MRYHYTLEPGFGTFAVHGNCSSKGALYHLYPNLMHTFQFLCHLNLLTLLLLYLLRQGRETGFRCGEGLKVDTSSQQSWHQVM